MFSSFLSAVWQSPPHLIALSLAAISLYVPINRMCKKGLVLKHRLDDSIPFVPGFVVPYALLYFPWLISFYIVLLSAPLIEVQRATLTVSIALAIGYFFFIFFPTCIETQHPTGKGLSTRLLKFLITHDREFNACPSMHVYMTTIFAIFSSRLYPAFTPLFILLCLLISASTVLTKRHYIYDVIGGFAVGMGASILALALL